MVKQSVKLPRPKEIPLEPAIHQFLLNLSDDKKQRKSMQVAINMYNKSCEEAYRQLINDLKKILEE